MEEIQIKYGQQSHRSYMPNACNNNVEILKMATNQAILENAKHNHYNNRVQEIYEHLLKLSTAVVVQPKPIKEISTI